MRLDETALPRPVRLLPGGGPPDRHIAVRTGEVRGPLAGKAVAGNGGDSPVLVDPSGTVRGSNPRRPPPC